MVRFNYLKNNSKYKCDYEMEIAKIFMDLFAKKWIHDIIKYN